MPYIDLTNRFLHAFGILRRGVNYGINYNPKSFEFLSSTDDEFEDVTFEFNGKKLEFSSKGTISSGALGTVVATPPLMSFSRSKKLITTPLQEDDAIVVERWSNTPWNIRMRGVIVDLKQHHYPEMLIKKLNRLFDHNGIVNVSGDRFHDKGIDSIYFTDINFSEIPGYEDTITYSISAKSIKEVGFTLINPN